MTYAVRKDDFVINMIVAHESQKQELETALSAELIDPTELGLTIGDFWNGENWTRNVDGEQVVLEPIIPEPTDLEQLRADVDYIAMETGVEL
jgi:hypothetical protein